MLKNPCCSSWCIHFSACVWLRVCALWRDADRSPNAAGWRKVNRKQKVPMEEVYDICQDPGWVGDCPPLFCRPRVTHRAAVAEVVTTPWHFLGNGDQKPGQLRTLKTRTYIWVNLSGGSGGHFLCSVCSSSEQKCQRLAYCCPPHVLFRVLDRGRSADMARSTNKQTEGIKIEKNREDEMWWRVFSAVRLMACSSHYSLLCPLPPIGCNNTTRHGCQCHIISYFYLTTWTRRATSHQDQFTVSYYSGSCVCSRWGRSFTLDLIIKKFSTASMRSN